MTMSNNVSPPVFGSSVSVFVPSHPHKQPAPVTLLSASQNSAEPLLCSSSLISSSVLVDTIAFPGPNNAPDVSSEYPMPISNIHSMQTRVKSGIRKPKAFLNTSVVPWEPKSFHEANQFPEWRTAMETKFNALVRNDTWVLVPKLQDQKVTGCLWVHKTKILASGGLDKRKSSLVA